MKKLKTIFGAMLFASIVLTSCGGNSIEGDAKKVADLQCRAMMLMEQVATGDREAIEESSKLAAEADALSKEMEKKYTSESDIQKFTEAFLKEIENCK